MVPRREVRFPCGGHPLLTVHFGSCENPIHKRVFCFKSKTRPLIPQSFWFFGNNECRGNNGKLIIQIRIVKYMCSGLILFYVLAVEERVKMGKLELRTVKRRNSCKIKRDLDFLIDISGVSLLLSF